MASHAYSVRDSLQVALQEFLRRSGLQCERLKDIVRELVSLLAGYREEGLPLFPEVFVFGSPDGLKALAPSSDQVTIGTLALIGGPAPRIIKDCAPLAVGGWAVFIVKESDSQLRYGLFRAVRHSLATAAEESMKDLGKDLPVILIRNRGQLVVELRSTVAEQFTATLRTVPAEPSPLEEHISRFVEAAARNTNDPLIYKPYLRRVLTGILQHSHGTLLAVVDPSKCPPDVHDSLTDGVWPSPPIDLAQILFRAIASDDAEGLAEVKSAEALLSGMVRSDGIVLFGSDGKIVAYRVFLKAQPEEVGGLPTSGGGRRRTYELMKVRVGMVFNSVFFRSQDGETGCEGGN
jgi:hypothetical protein